MLKKSCDYCEKLYQKDNSMCPICEMWEGNVSMEEIAENCTEYKKSKHVIEVGDVNKFGIYDIVKITSMDNTLAKVLMAIQNTDNSWSYEVQICSTQQVIEVKESSLVFA